MKKPMVRARRITVPIQPILIDERTQVPSHDQAVIRLIERYMLLEDVSRATLVRVMKAIERGDHLFEGRYQ